MSKSGPTIDNVSMPGGTVTENSVISVSGQARPNNTVDIGADLTTTTMVNQKIVIYVRLGATGSGVQPHTDPMAKRLPACRKGMRGCVARTVTRRITHMARLYRVAARVHADRTGHFNATLRLHYWVHKAMQAMLIVTARTSQGWASRRMPVRVVPPQAHKGVGKGGTSENR